MGALASDLVEMATWANPPHLQMGYQEWPPLAALTFNRRVLQSARLFEKRVNDARAAGIKDVRVLGKD